MSRIKTAIIFDHIDNQIFIVSEDKQNFADIYKDIESDLTLKSDHNWRWIHTESAIEFDGKDDHITIKDNDDVPTGASSFTDTHTKRWMHRKIANQ
mgnify:CR=1 FL=1